MTILGRSMAGPPAAYAGHTAPAEGGTSRRGCGEVAAGRPAVKARLYRRLRYPADGVGIWTGAGRTPLKSAVVERSVLCGLCLRNRTMNHSGLCDRCAAKTAVTS
jgi:hypothetical protein